MRARGIEFASNVTGDCDGPTLLWGHALMGSMKQEDQAGFMPWIGLDEGTRLVRWDARGHGASEATLVDEHYCWSELATDLWSIADSLGIEEAVLGGVSMGAGTALLAATQAPERTRGLVLMAPPTAWDTRPRQSKLYRSTARMIERVGLGPLRFFGALAGLGARGSALSRLQWSVMSGLRRADARAVQCALRGAALSDLPPKDSLAAIEAPTLILAWKGDWSHPLSSARELAAHLPRAHLEVAGDTSEIEDWPGLVQSFLDSLRPESLPVEPKKTTGM
jgi:pimeloyl-ACP methyl ester carboxylesterase